ncbi:MAG: hypothetical protein ACOC56_05750 [Atribacterota bacterium]
MKLLLHLSAFVCYFVGGYFLVLVDWKIALGVLLLFVGENLMEGLK